MSERIRFHLDENVDPAIALSLRRYGIDVTTTNEVDLRGETDEVQLKFIQQATGNRESNYKSDINYDS